MCFPKEYTHQQSISYSFPKLYNSNPKFINYIYIYQNFSLKSQNGIPEIMGYISLFFQSQMNTE